MKFKIAENLPVEIAELLRESGFDAVTVHEQDLVGAPDTDLFAVCCREERTLVTFDLDFSDIRTYPPEVASGIIVFRLAHQEKTYVIEVATRVVSRLSSEPLEGHLWIVTEQGIRIRGGSPDQP